MPIYAKPLQTSAMKAIFKLSSAAMVYAKPLQTSAMKAIFKLPSAAMVYAKVTKKSHSSPSDEKNGVSLCTIFNIR